jgi:polar amino acid transport system substrate-binding protein
MANEIPMHATPERNRSPLLSWIALGLATIALVLTLLWRPTMGAQPSTPSEGTLARIVRTQTLRVGYEGYPPYTIKDPSTGKLSGISVEIADLIAREAGWKVEWVESSPDTKIPDLQAGKFDVMTEPILGTIPRASRVGFTRPYAYFGDASAIVRKGEARFKGIHDLNQPGVTIAVRAGYTDQTYAADNLPAASLRALKVEDTSQVFLEVIAGKADVALANSDEVRAFVAAHPSEVEARFVDPAPAYIPAGLMLRQGDFTFYNFLNVALDYLDTNGDLARVRNKYGISPASLPTHR